MCVVSLTIEPLKESALCNVRNVLCYCAGAGTVDIGLPSVSSAFAMYGIDVSINGAASCEATFVLAHFDQCYCDFCVSG